MWQIIDKIFNVIESFDNIMIFVGPGITILAFLILLIYRKKKGISHKIDRSVTDEEIEAASEYREKWLAEHPEMLDEEDYDEEPEETEETEETKQ